MREGEQDIPASPPATDCVASDGRAYRRLALRTHWLEPGEDLLEVALRYAGPIRRPGDVLLVSEKALAVTLGQAIPADRLKPGRLATTLAGAVASPTGPGLNVPEKMQYVVERAGVPRVLAAAGYGALTRPSGKRGGFHCVIGEWCRHIDGMCPPYEDAVIPPLASGMARLNAERLAAELGMATAIIDLNDRGGTVRSVSGGLDAAVILSALEANPLGQRAQSTPIGLLRPLEPTTEVG